MKITFLGTGTSQGVPLIGCNCIVCSSNNPKEKRLRSSILVEVDDLSIVIDTGPDFRQQMLNEKVKKIDAVLFTHEHKDHIAGLDDIRAYNFMHKKKMEIYASENVQEALKREFHYIFNSDNYPGIPEINLNNISNEPFFINGVKIIPILVYHYKLPVYGFRINDFTYITDSNYISDLEKEKIKGSKVIVLNALRKEKHISHFTFNEAIEIMQELKPESGYFTHISHQLGLSDKLEEELPSFIKISFDGLKIEL